MSCDFCYEKREVKIVSRFIVWIINEVEEFMQGVNMNKQEERRAVQFE